MPHAGAAAALSLAALLGGCALGPPRSADRSGRDGPGANPPADLSGVPDATPRLEPIRAGGPNKPYEALGHRYAPFTDDRTHAEQGLASWYGAGFHGRPTSSGEPYDMYAMTAAHPTLPIPSYARIRNPANRREIVVRVNDRGPFVAGRIVDLSYTAAWKLDVLRGVAPVELERITFDDIRSGAWRRGVLPGEPPADAVVAASVETALAAAPPTPVAAPAAGFWVQLGAFRQQGGADSLLRQVGSQAGWLAPLLTVVGESALFRLQAGPYPSRSEASGVAERVREALRLVPVIVERR